MKSVGLIQVMASLFGLFVVTSLLVGYNMTPMFEMLNSSAGFFGLLSFIAILGYAERR
jgi:hypothetical protein|tara:strand:- start:1151 stop:1324 length:174 start_codon:yes stop_codon:yes gene_type:complete